MGREDIRHPYRAAARPGDHRDAVAARQAAEREGGGDIEHVVEILAVDDAVMAKDRVIDIAGLRQRAGMRGRGTAPGGRPANFGDDQRLAGRCRFIGDRAEAIGAADPFEVEQKDFGIALVEPPIDVVVGFEHGLIAGADLVREMQLLVPAAAEKREGQRAALAADRDRLGSASHRQQASAGVVKDRAESRDEGP